MSITTVLNLSDPQKKQMLIQHVRTLDGNYRIEIVRARMKASQLQHAYYRAVVVATIADEYRAQGNNVTDAQVHNRFADMFLRETIANQKTGEMWGEVTRSSGDLNTAEMADFIEKVRAEAAQAMGLDIPDPDPMWRFNQTTKAKVVA